MAKTLRVPFISSELFMCMFFLHNVVELEIGKAINSNYLKADKLTCFCSCEHYYDDGRSQSSPTFRLLSRMLNR